MSSIRSLRRFMGLQRSAYDQYRTRARSTCFPHWQRPPGRGACRSAPSALRLAADGSADRLARSELVTRTLLGSAGTLANAGVPPGVVAAFATATKCAGAPDGWFLQPPPAAAAARAAAPAQLCRVLARTLLAWTAPYIRAAQLTAPYQLLPPRSGGEQEPTCTRCRIEPLTGEAADTLSDVLLSFGGCMLSV